MTATTSPYSEGTATAGTVSVSETFKAAGNLAGDVGRVGTAWFELARAEMAVARLSAVRLMLGTVLATVLGFGVWLFACLALGYWLAAMFGRTDLAFGAVALVNVTALTLLIVQMRRWWLAMQMPDSRAALGEIARTLS